MQVSNLFIDAGVYNETQNPIQAWASLVACLESGQLDKLPPEVQAYFCRAGNALLFGESDEKLLGKTLANALEFSHKSQLGEVRDELQACEEMSKIWAYQTEHATNAERDTDHIAGEGPCIYKPNCSQNTALDKLNITANGAGDKTGLSKRTKYINRMWARFGAVFKK